MTGKLVSGPRKPPGPTERGAAQRQERARTTPFTELARPQVHPQSRPPQARMTPKVLISAGRQLGSQSEKGTPAQKSVNKPLSSLPYQPRDRGDSGGQATGKAPAPNPKPYGKCSSALGSRLPLERSRRFSFALTSSKDLELRLRPRWRGASWAL